MGDRLCASPVDPRQKRMVPSFVPPPVASISGAQGHHAKAFTVVVCFVMRHLRDRPLFDEPEEELEVELEGSCDALLLGSIIETACFG